MYVSRLLELTTRSEEILADAFRNLAAAHPDEPDIRVMGMEMARECSGEVEELKRLAARYPADLGDRLDVFVSPQLDQNREPGLSLLRDLQQLHLMTDELDLELAAAGQAGQALQDQDFIATIKAAEQVTQRQQKWLKSRIKQAAPQILVAMAEAH